MHDWEDPGLAPVFFFRSAIIRDETDNLRFLIEKMLGRPRAYHCIKVPRKKQFGQRTVGDGRVADALRNLEVHLLGAPRLIHTCLIPVDILERYADLVHEITPHVYGGRLCPFGNANLFASEILRLLDNTIPAHVDGG